MTQRRLLVAPAGEPADAESFGPGSVGDILIRKSPAIPGAPDDYGWGAVLGRSAATSADLSSAAFANMPIGIGAYVVSRGRIYWSVPLGRGDIAGTGNDWKSDPSTSDPNWLTETAWFISNAGNDDSSGILNGEPLLTVNELQARWGIMPVLTTNVTITFLTDHPGGVLQFSRTTLDVLLKIIGKPTVLVSDVVAAFADISGAANAWARLTGTAILDFTPFVNQQIAYTSGPANGAVDFVVLQNPQAAGLNVTEVMKATPPLSTANNYFAAAVNPVAGNTFDIRALPVIDALVLECNDICQSRLIGATNSSRPTYQLENLYVKQFAAKADSIGSASRLYWGCMFNNLSDPTANPGNASLFSCLNVMNHTRVQAGTYSQCAFKATGAAIAAALNCRVPVSFINVIFEGCTFAVNSSNTITGSTTGFFNAAGVGLILSNTCTYVASGSLLGQGNGTTGASVAIDATLVLTTGMTVKLTGTNPDWRFGNAAPYFTWAQAPRLHARGSFADTLGAGATKVVSIPNLPADARVWATTKTPAGAGAPGVLSIPTAGRTANSVTVNSSVATDTSTFEGGWESPSGGVGGVVNG